MEPQNFLQLAHGQPLLWQLGFSTYQWGSVRHGCLRRRSNLMPIIVPNYSRNTDWLQFGTLINILRNPHTLMTDTNEKRSRAESCRINGARSHGPVRLFC